MKRHFSNRGEAISEVTAARVLARRKASVNSSFMPQAARRTNLPFRSSQGMEVGNRPRKKQTRRNEDDRIMF
jgi:hypothetical protein